MKSWIEDFQERTELNKYPVALRTRGGVGYKLPGGETVSTFTGHPVHYLDSGLWKPITLQPHANGDFEGSDFGWKGKQVTYKGKRLFEPKAVIFNGTRHKLNLRQDGNRIVADLPFGAQYEIIFSENGVRELLTIPQPIEGLLEFDVPHAVKPNKLHKKDRHIIGGITAETFQLTKDMVYPLVIDPDYSADSGDFDVYGYSATYSTARSTSYDIDTGVSQLYCGQQYAGGFKYIYRPGIKFLTSGIPDDDVISEAVMKLVCITDGSVTDFDVTIQKQDWSAQDPIGAGNREAFYDNCLAAVSDVVWRNTSGMSVNTQYTSPALDVTRVSKTGHTYYSLISSRDIGNNDPGTTNEYIGVGSQENGTSGYRPVLTVTHAAAVNSGFFFFF